MKWLGHHLIRQSEKQTGEQSDFIRDMLDASRGAFWKFGLFIPMARHKGPLPGAAIHAARIAAVHAEDCGPCLQTTINNAAHDQVDPAILRALVEGNVEALDLQTRTVFLFARALVARDLEAETYRAQIERWWGKAGLTEIALAVAATRVFPTVKRAMDYGEACLRVTIARETTSTVKATSPRPRLTAQPVN